MGYVRFDRTALVAALWVTSAHSLQTQLHPPVLHEAASEPVPLSTAEELEFADVVQRWNGPFLWQPASASSNPVSRLGDEARAVFGAIPDADCTDGAGRSINLEVDGNVVDLRPNPEKEGSPLEFEHRNVAGDLVKWTSSIAQCDKPSLAGNVTYCGMNSRLTRTSRGNVVWTTFCRKSTLNLGIEPDPYWQKSNPKFARLGVIGFNRVSGEIVFFDGREDGSSFDWSGKFVPPGGHSYLDRNGRLEAEVLYDPTFQVQCSACHDNKGPYAITPHMEHSRVGFLGGAESPQAVFGLSNYLSDRPRSELSPYRIIGSGYTRIYSFEILQAKTVNDPAGNCTECHTLTTQITGQRFAADAVAQEPSIANPNWAQTLQLRAERMKLREIDSHRTDWARRSGAGGIFPWMYPVEGNNLARGSTEIDLIDWRELSNCLWGAGGSECGYKPLYTPCPAPGVPSQGDRSVPSGSTISDLPLPHHENPDRALRINWNYLNNYGGVPQRDDVRFNVAVKMEALSSSGPPVERDYPSVEEATGKNATFLKGEVASSGEAVVIQNVSYFGHQRFTEPKPSSDLRQFQLDLPAKCNRRYLARILAKRFCFDQTDVVYADEGDLLFADVLCK